MAVVGPRVGQLGGGADLDVVRGDGEHPLDVATLEDLERLPDELDVGVALAQGATVSRWKTRFESNRARRPGGTAKVSAGDSITAGPSTACPERT